MTSEHVHIAFMRRAIELASKGGRSVMPNPMVGAVIVESGEIIGEGYHQRYGEPHAEVLAVQGVADRSRLERATAYVTLEPCCHYGKTPPCADLIVDSRIPHVVIGSADPFPRVSGGGIKRLREAGITVTEGVLRNECLQLNHRFMTCHRMRRPYVILKWAQTSDGFIARSDYTSKWISSDESRQLVHIWRGEEAAILVGRRTAEVDNPMLTARIDGAVNPTRIVLDRRLQLPPTLHLFSSQTPTMVFNDSEDSFAGNVTRCRIDFEAPVIPQVLDRLYRERLISLIVEGGAETLQSFIESGYWDEARVFTSEAVFVAGILAPNVRIEAQESVTVGSDRLTLSFHPERNARIGITEPFSPDCAANYMLNVSTKPSL